MGWDGMETAAVTRDPGPGIRGLFVIYKRLHRTGKFTHVRNGQLGQAS